LKPVETEIFGMKKHFSSPASKEFFLEISNMPFHYKLKNYKIVKIWGKYWENLGY
jgi:hypothetical protein